MKKDLIIFIKYLFNLEGLYKTNVKTIKNFLKPINISYFFMIGGFYFFLKSSLGFALICFVIAFFIQLRIAYISGEHRHWHNKKQGIKSKKELLRKEWDSRDDNLKIEKKIDND